MKKTKLFFIINTFSAGGGAEALLSTVANSLDDSGRYEIGIMEIIHYDIKKEQIHSAIKIYPYYVDAEDPDRKAKMHYVYHDWDKIIDEYIPSDYDVYISFNYVKPSFLLPKNKKCIAWINEDMYRLVNRYPGLHIMTTELELQREAFKKASYIVAISDNTKKSIVDLFPECKNKIRTIYNGIDIRNIQIKAKEDAPINIEKPAIMFVGRLDKLKNPIRALNIFAEVQKRKPNAHLYYLGYGILNENIISMMKEKNIERNVHLLGFYENPFPIIRQADVVLMTSMTEGFPLSLLEAVSLNVPFVSTKIGGSIELASYESCGEVFDEDCEAVEYLIKYIEMDKEDIKRKTDNAIQNFSLELFMSNVEGIIRELINC